MSVNLSLDVSVVEIVPNPISGQYDDISLMSLQSVDEGRIWTISVTPNLEGSVKTVGIFWSHEVLEPSPINTEDGVSDVGCADDSCARVQSDDGDG